MRWMPFLLKTKSLFFMGAMDEVPVFLWVQVGVYERVRMRI